MTTTQPTLTMEMPAMDRARIAAWLRSKAPHVAMELAINFAAPIVIYDQLHARLGDVPALLVSTAPPLVWSVAGFARNRRIDALSIISMVGIALSILAFFGGGSAKLLQLRETSVTLLIGLAFLGSAAIGKPLIYPLARATMARESAEELARFEARRDHPMLRRTMMIMTLVWGFGLVANFAVSVVLIYSLSIAEYMIVGSIFGYASMGGLTLWTFLYRRNRMRLRDALEAQAKAEELTQRLG